MPVGAVVNAPAMQMAIGPVYRATIALAVAYWRSGCTGLPGDEVTLSALVRLPVAHIRPIKGAVLNALSQITPELDTAHTRCMEKYRHNLSTCETMRQRAQEKRVRIKSDRLTRKAELPPLPLPVRGDDRRDDTDRPAVPYANQGRGVHASPRVRSKSPVEAGFTD